MFLQKNKWDQNLLNELENKNIKMCVSTFALMFRLPTVHKAVCIYFFKDSFLHFSNLCASTCSSLCGPNVVMRNVGNTEEGKYDKICLIHINW